MNTISRQFALSACALATTVLLTACGGGEATAPPDTQAPTVVITDSVAAASTDGPVTFTFTFSESVGSSFSAAAVAVTGGTKGAFAMASDGKSATLIVTPTANSSGTLKVDLVAGAFSDTAGNKSTTAYTGSQDYDTKPPVLTTGTLLISFDETNPATTGMGAYGGALPSVEAGPTGGSGNALKIVKPVSPDTWGGTYFTVAALPFTADRKVITARVYASRAGAIIKLKVEIAGGASVEVAGTATGAANTWGTVSWDLGAVDASKSYTVMAITPDADLATTGRIYYIDELTLAPAAAVVPPPAAGVAFLTFDETVPAFSEMGAYGGALPTVEAGPTGGSGNALKILKPVSPDTWGGVYFTTSAIPFTAANKAISARVYSSRAGAVIKFKVEVPGGGNVEVASSPTGAANTWTTLTWDFSAINLASSYKIMAITPDAETVTTGQTYYIDTITVVPVSTAGALSYIVQPFIENVQSAYDTVTSKAKSGNYTTGYYAAPGMTWWWGGAFKSKLQGGYGVSKADTTQSYFGQYIANGGTGWDIASASSYAFKLGTNGECAGKCKANVRLVSAVNASCVADIKVALTAAAVTAYSAKLADFTVTGCATNTMAAFKTGKVAELHFQMLRADMQFTTTTDTGGLYPNGLDMADSIGFDAPTGAPAPEVDPVVTGPVFSSMTFDVTTVSYLSTDFGGTVSSIGAGPAGSNGKVLKVNKLSGAEQWAGTTVSTLPNQAIDKIPFTASAKKMTLRVWAPAAGMTIRMKLEDATDVTHNCETDTKTTVANAWETLTFDFATRAFNNGDPTQLTSNRCVDSTLLLASVMNKASVFPNFGTAGAVTGDFYFDDLKYVP